MGCSHLLFGAYPSMHLARCRVHSGQVASLDYFTRILDSTQSIFQINHLIYKMSKSKKNIIVLNQMILHIQC